MMGGANWGGAAFNPETGVLYIRAENRINVFKLEKTEPGLAEVDYLPDNMYQPEAVPHSHTPEGEDLPDGLPIHKPPYAVLTEIDLIVGAQVWQVPLGDSPEIRTHPLLLGLDLPRFGVIVGHGGSGPLVTRSGLVFISGGGFKFYAIDNVSGKTLYGVDLDGGGYGNPMTYQTHSGRQFVVIATGRGSDAKLIAFALPQH